ncbi:MAG: PAS domain S-box protein, partial [Pseudomonadota bacterium]
MISILPAGNPVCDSIFEELPDVIVFTDPKRHVVKVNPAAERIFGYEQAELLGQKTVMLFETKAEFLRQGRLRYNLKTRDKPSLYVTNYRRKDGSVFPGE